MRRVLTDAEHAFLDRLIDAHRITNSVWKARREDEVKDAFGRAMARRVVRELEHLLPALRELADRIEKPKSAVDHDVDFQHHRIGRD